LPLRRHRSLWNVSEYNHSVALSAFEVNKLEIIPLRFGNDTIGVAERKPGI
jgi:hypothetical protein